MDITSFRPTKVQYPDTKDPIPQYITYARPGPPVALSTVTNNVVQPKPEFA
jgi:hypothetical protein